MAKNYRAGRLGEEIRKTIGMMLLTELKDHRLQGKMVSVTDVDVSSDGSYATVYLSVLGSNISSDTAEDEKNDVLAAMKSAAGMIRHQLGRDIKVRHVPELTFKYDSAMEYGRHMSQVIDSLHISNDEDSHDEDGRDEDSYDENGRDEDGYDEDGRDEDGYDEDGRDEESYDEDGEDAQENIDEK